MIEEIVEIFTILKVGYWTIKEIKKRLGKGNLDKSSKVLVKAFERAFKQVTGLSIYSLEYPPDNTSDKINVGVPNIICYILEYLNDPKNFTKTIIGNLEKYSELNILSEVEINMIKEYFESELSNSQSLPYMIELLTQLRKDSITQKEDHLKIDSKMNLVISYLENIIQTNRQITDSEISKLNYEEVDYYLERKVRLIADKNDTASKYLGKLEPDDLFQELINEKRIILLASVGMGKTIELKQLAHYSSHIEESLWPFLKDLKYYKGENIPEDIPEFVDTNKLSENKVLLIFDGFDEIITEHRNSFISALEQYIENHPKAHIVISSRFNFFEREELTGADSIVGFKKYELLPLSQMQIDQFIQDNEIELPKADLGSDFWAIPFNLFVLKEVGSEIGNINTKNDLLQIFLQQTIIKSKKNKGIRFRSFDINASYNDLKKVSFYMLKNEKNFVSEDELLNLKLQKPNEIDLPGILEKFKDSGDYQFNHKNYQEYLAAQTFKEMSFDGIVQIVTYEDKTVIPYYIDVLSLLLNEEFDYKYDLIKFIDDNDRTSLIRLNYTKIEENLKLDIFKQSFEAAAENNQYYVFEGISEDIIKQFISTDSIENYLLDILENNENENDHYRYLAIKMLTVISIPIEKERIKNILNQILIKKKPKYKSIIYNTIWYLYDHTNQFTGDDLEYYISQILNERHLYSSILSIIAKYQISNRYIDYFIKVMKIVMSKPEDDKGTLQYYTYEFRENFAQLNLDELIKIYIEIDWTKSVYSFNNYHEIILKAIFEKSTDENKSKIFKIICELFENDILFSYNDIFDLILSYLVDSNQLITLINTFEEDENTYGFYIHIADFIFKKGYVQNVNIEQFDTICKIIELKPIDAFFRLSNYEYDERVKEYSKLYPQQYKEYLKIKKNDNIYNEKILEDIQNLFDMSYWEKEIIEVFNFYGDEIDKRFFNYNPDFNKKAISQNITKFLMELIRKEKIIKKTDAFKLFEVNFENITIAYIYEKMQDFEQNDAFNNTEKIKITDINNQIVDFVKDYCENNIDKINIRNSLKGRNSSYTVTVCTLRIEFFSVKYNFKYTLEKMLDYLYFSLNWNEFNYFSKYCYNENPTKTITTIEEFLNSNSQFALLRRNHLQFCKNHNLEFASKYAIKELLNKPFEDRFRFTEPKFAALAIINSKENTNKLIEIFNVMIDRNDDFIPEFIEKIDNEILGNPKFVDALIRLSKKNISNSEHAAFKLISLNNPTGLEYLISSFQIGIKWFDRFRYNTPFANVSKPKMEPLMFELFKLYIEGIIKDSDDFHRFIDALMIGYKNIMLSNKDSYIKVPEKLKRAILTIKDKSPEVYSNLYRQITEIEKEGKDKFRRRK